jgi:hypothetical protein
MDLLDLIKFLVPQMKNAETELTAYRMTLEAFKQVFPQHTQLLDATLATSRQSPALADLMRKKWDEPLERFLQRESESPTVEGALEMFRKMPKDGPIN